MFRYSTATQCIAAELVHFLNYLWFFHFLTTCFDQLVQAMDLSTFVLLKNVLACFSLSRLIMFIIVQDCQDHHQTYPVADSIKKSEGISCRDGGCAGGLER